MPGTSVPLCLGTAQGTTYEEAIAGGRQEIHAGVVHHPKALMRDPDLVIATP